MKLRHHLTAGLVLVAALLPVTTARDIRREAPPGVIRSAPFAWRGSAETRDLGTYLEVRVDSAQREKGVAALKRADQQTAAKQYAAALKSYDSAMKLLPNLKDWVGAFAAGVSATMGDTADVNDRLAALDSLVRVDWAWRTEVRAYRNAGNRAAAMRVAKSYIALPGSARRQSEAWGAIGEMRLETADTSGAVAAFTQSMDAWPNSEAALESARLLSTLPGLTAYHHLRIGRIYLRWGNQKRGLEGLKAVLASSVVSADTAARVRLELGRAYFAADRYRDAEKVLLDVAQLPAAPFAAEALYLAGRAQYRAGDEAAGRQTLAKVATRFPDHPIAAQALYLAGDLAQDNAEPQRAAEFFKRATEVGPRTEPAGISHMRLAGMALVSGNQAAAARRFDDYAKAFTNGIRHQQAIFWLGRTQLALGQRDSGRVSLREARDLDPYSFYGLRAAELLDESVFTERLGAAPVTPRRTTALVDGALQRLALLRRVGWTEAAAFEQDRVKQYFAKDVPALYALAEGLNQQNHASAGTVIARELYRQGGSVWNDRLLRIAYPFPFKPAIVKQARSRGIDPFLMVALIRQESAFNPNATSPVGAMGLMQVMPKTGRALARPLGIKGFKQSMLHDPEINIRIGAKFLSDMIKAWNGRPDYVLAAYNAGSSRVERWRQFPEARDRDLFLERIPFDETRDYVRVVQLNARIYERLYGSEESRAQTKK